MQGAGLEIGAKELTAGAQHAFRSDQGYPNSYWRSLFYFNVYRLIVATLLLVTAAVFEDSLFGSRSLPLFLYAPCRLHPVLGLLLRHDHLAPARLQPAARRAGGAPTCSS